MKCWILVFRRKKKNRPKKKKSRHQTVVNGDGASDRYTTLNLCYTWDSPATVGQTEPIVGNVSLNYRKTVLAVKQSWRRSPPPLEARILALGRSLAFRISSSDEAATPTHGVDMCQRNNLSRDLRPSWKWQLAQWGLTESWLMPQVKPVIHGHHPASCSAYVGTLTQEGGDKQRYPNQAGLILFPMIL